MIKRYKNLWIALGVLSLTSGIAVADDLCPDVETEMGNAPVTLAEVQNDIDRYQLCLERTKILTKLDEMALELEELGRPEEGSLPNFGAAMGQAGNIAAVPMPQLPLGTPAVQEPESDWRVRRIWGTMSGLKAQLVDDEGVLETVSQGDTLSSGETVTKLSARSISLTKDGKTNVVPWGTSSTEAQ